jgi:hypothetical protein
MWTVTAVAGLVWAVSLLLAVTDNWWLLGCVGAIAVWSLVMLYAYWREKRS